MKIEYPEVGICDPHYFTDSKSRCLGCKSEDRMAVGCPFITCAIKKKGFEFCWDCQENTTCLKWRKHREFGSRNDTFKCYQKLENNIAFIQKNGVAEFEKLQKIKEQLLREMLDPYPI